jgi:hypothetical protein
LTFAEREAAKGKPASTPLGVIVEKYLVARKEEFRPKSYSEVKRYLERAWKPLHKRAVGAVVRADIVSVVDDIERDSGKPDPQSGSASLQFGWPVGMPLCRPLGKGLVRVAINAVDAPHSKNIALPL